MAKLAQTSVKYLVKATFDADGMVERPDVIGALFGQTEGLLGPELDLRELQRTGRLGRIEVIVKGDKGKAKGEIIIPSSLDGTETALIAASLETIDRVGPCNAKIKVESVEDLRTIKRTYILDRAKELLGNLLYQIPDTAVITEELMQSVRSAEIAEYKGLPAGPEAATSDGIILCEGRADVVNLLRHGVKNAVAIGGTAIPPIIADIIKEKEITAFLDGDRGGDLILKELRAMGEIDFVARAPAGKEVEELTKKEVYKCIRERVPVEQAANVGAIPQESAQRVQPSAFGSFSNGGQSRQQSDSRQGSFRGKPSGPSQRFERKPMPAIRPAMNRPMEAAAPVRTYEARPSFEDTSVQLGGVSHEEHKLDADAKKFFKAQLNELVGTRAAAIFDKDNNFSGRVPVKELEHSLEQVADPATIVLDDDVTLELVRLAEGAGVQTLIGTKVHDKPKSRNVKIFASEDLE